MRISYAILVASIIAAAAGGFVAARLATASSAPDLGEPVVVSPSPVHSSEHGGTERAPDLQPPSSADGGHADPVSPRAPSAGDDDDADDDADDADDDADDDDD